MSSLLFAALLAAAQTNYDHGALSNDEQNLLEMINRARRNPDAEGIRLGIAINEGLSAAPTTVIPRPPLAANPKLSAASKAHVDHLYAQDYLDENFPAGTVPPTSTLTPQIRATNAGYVFSATEAWIGENVATSSTQGPVGLFNLLMLDAGVSERIHRRKNLDIYASTPGLPFRELGIAYADKLVDKGTIKRHILVQDFASTAQAGLTGPFLVGVVYADADGDLQYDPGEGIGGVDIRISGHAWKAVTSPSGGYAIPIAGVPSVSGIATVQASGGSGGEMGITGTVKKFRVTGQNVRLEFLPADLVDTDVPLDGIPDYWEAFYFSSVVATSDADGDGATALEEYQFGSNPDLAVSTPDNPIGAPASSSTDEEKVPEGCGALGLEVFLLLGLLRLLRR